MKQALLLITFCLFTLLGVQAQQPQGRTTSTVIADALAQLPAETQDEYNRIIADLMSTGEEGLLHLVKMIHPPGPKSNETVEFALSGWTNRASTENAQRETAAKAYIKALETTDVIETKAFIIRQLELIGQSESIAPLTAYLSDKKLADPAAQALATIKSSKANEVLLSTLQNSQDESLQTTLVNAIGQAEYETAEPALLAMLKGAPSNELKGALLSALSRLGSKKSLKTLRANAEEANFEYNKVGATKAYTDLLHKLAKSQQPKVVQKDATELLAKATQLDKQELRINALEILMTIPGTKKAKLLEQALVDEHLDYVTKALTLYSNNEGSNKNQVIIDQLTNTNVNAQTAIIYWLGNEQVKAGIPAIINNLNSTEEALQKAAISSAEKLGGPEILDGLTQLLQSNDEKSIALAKEALSTYKTDISSQLAQVFPNAIEAGKEAILELLGSRYATSQYNMVRDQLSASNVKVKKAALNALPYVVTQDNITELFELLEASTTENRAAIQKAINSALSTQSSEEQIRTIHTQMEKSDSKEYLYYSLLANTGNQKALKQLEENYEKATGNFKTAAFDALTQWQGFEVIHPLLSIARNSEESSETNKAVDAIISLITKSNQTGEVRTIFLREAMSLANTDKQKTNILKAIGNTGTFQGLVFLEKYLDDTSLQETAAQSIISIALNHNEYAGEITSRILNKTSKILNNPDAGYQRQAIQKYLDENPTQGGYVSMFNGENLDGWQGLVGNPISRSKMSEKELAAKQTKANRKVANNWSVKDGTIVFDGEGENLCSVKEYGDFEMFVDWRITKGGDSGIYLRGTPQVQIWDTSLVKVGAQVGSGGLYNNKKNETDPLVVADNQLGEWNTFHITMVGEKVTVWLNGQLVVDNVTMENYWDRSQPIFPTGPIELQAHGSDLAFRDIYVRELKSQVHTMTPEEEKEGFTALFDGSNLDQWTGNTTDYVVEDGNIVIYPSKRFGGNLYTKKEYADFVFRFEFQLTPAANNGLGIRTPMEGDAAYVGMELQILDNTAPVYAKLHEYQFHGSVYGVIPAKRGYLNPVGEWNVQEVIANGDNIKITLNGTVILDGNIREASKEGTADGKKHPGLLNKKGHIAFLGHGSVVKFRNIRIKEIE